MLDHGLLNVPLSKRGNIDNQIDRYKREQEAARRMKQKAVWVRHQLDKIEAKRILAAIESAPGLLEKKASDRGITRKELLGLLRDIATSKPKAMQTFEREWLEPSATAIDKVMDARGKLANRPVAGAAD